MRNHSLDTLKFICAILVVFLHTRQATSVETIMDPLRRCAVPIFFMISGYFTYGKENAGKTLRKRIIHTLKIFCFSYLFYMLIPVLHGRSFDVLIEVLKNNYENARLLICYNHLTDGYHLWYVHAYIYVLAIMLLIDRFKLYKLLFYATPLLLLAGLYIGKYQEIIGGATFAHYMSRNFLFTGLPFFAIGAYIKKEQEKIADINKNSALLGFFLFYFIGLFECSAFNLLYKAGDLYISTAFAAVFMFIYFLNVEQNNDNIFSRMGREESLYIYIFHVFFASEIHTHLTKEGLLHYWEDIGTFAVLIATPIFIFLLRKLKIIGRII